MSEREQFDAWFAKRFVCADFNGSHEIGTAMGYAWEGWQGRAITPTPVCATCNGHGMIGGPSYSQPDEGGEPCPDCNATATDEETAELLGVDQRQAIRIAIDLADANGYPETCQTLRALLQASRR